MSAVRRLVTGLTLAAALLPGAGAAGNSTCRADVQKHCANERPGGDRHQPDHHTERDALLEPERYVDPQREGGAQGGDAQAKGKGELEMFFVERRTMERA